MAERTILIIEDEPDILEMISYNLSREGFNVLTAGDGEEGLRRAREAAPDLILLDLMLPRMDGLEICRILKGDELTSAIAIVMVTAKGEESDVVLGLGLGADDYISKPFRPKELVARVRAVLRRAAQTPKSTVEERIERGPLTIDTVRHQATAGGRDLGLTATEFRLLTFLASHPGRVFTRDQLINHVLGQLAAVTPRNIDVHIRSVRKKLAGERDLIETIRGVGYRFLEL